MSGVVLTDVHKAYASEPVLDGLCLSLEEHTITALLGPSGAGKTTVLRLLAGFERCDHGRVEMGGRVVDGDGTYLPPERRRVGYVPQDAALFPHLSVAANVAFGLPRAGRRERVRELLATVGLDGLGGRRPHELSGGQQQRVALARALAVRPALMLLDEPFAALDARLRESVRAEVRDILRRAGTTVVLVTHDRDEALSLADTVAVLRRGRIAQSAPPDVLYTSPVDAAVARFVGEANLVPGRFDGRAVWTALGTALATDTGSRRPPSGPVTVLVRPEALSLALPGAPGLAGRVVDATYHGAETMIRVRPDADAWAGEALLVESRGAATVRVGDPVVVTIGVERVHLLPP